MSQPPNDDEIHGVPTPRGPGPMHETFGQPTAPPPPFVESDESPSEAPHGVTPRPSRVATVPPPSMQLMQPTVPPPSMLPMQPTAAPPSIPASGQVTGRPPPIVSRLPPSPSILPGSAGDAVAWLRAEVSATTIKPRQARLLGEIGEIEEQAADEAGAARDYLAAFNADSTFREPLEGLVRLLERRRSFKNLGKVIDAFVKSSKKPEEAARALLMKTAYAADVTGDLEAARDLALMASKAATAGPESALAWITVEILAGKLGDRDLRREALAKRVAHTTDPTWRGLLLVDLAELAAEGGEVGGALALLHDAERLGGAATFVATVATTRLVRHDPGAPGSADADTRMAAYALALEGQAGVIRDAMADAARGDRRGVPHWARTRAHMAEAWLQAAHALVGNADLTGAARVLDAATTELGEPQDGEALLFAAFRHTRMRVAELQGDAALVASLAEQRLADEADPRLASALALRVAEHALASEDTAGALRTLASALAKDPSELATRSLLLDLVVKTADGARQSAELEAYSDQLTTPETRARTLAVAALLAGTEGGDVPRARALLAKASALAPNAGVPETDGGVPGFAARLGRLIGAVRGDAALRDEATRSLLASGVDEREQVGLWFEVVRASFARGSEADAEVALQALSETSDGAWLAGLLQTFLPGRTEGQPAALDALRALETDEQRATALGLIAALRAHHQGDREAARTRLRALLETAPDHVIVVTYLAELERSMGLQMAAAETASRGANATDDPELAAALHLEAGLDRWRGADRKGAIDAFERAVRAAPDAAKPLLRWASRGVDLDTIDGRRTAIERAAQAGEDELPLALERFATELAAGDGPAAEQALAPLDHASDAALLVAGDLARIVSPPSAFSSEANDDALARLGALGQISATAAAAEGVRAARVTLDRFDPNGPQTAARRWLDADGGVAAALEWLAASLGTPSEVAARRALAKLFDGDDREAILATAALLEARVEPPGAIELVDGDSDAARLANLELSPPYSPGGTDLARRAKALSRADSALGADGDAAALGAWSLLANGNSAEALEAFGRAARGKPQDLAAWAGFHAAARVAGDKPAEAEAAAVIGERCSDAARGAKFWEEAGLILLDLGRGEEAERALAAAFQRDPSRAVAFDRLFRRVRERKDADALLDLVSKRLEFSDDPAEIVKLYWERSRVLREKGDLDGAVVALENVTMVEPDHVGALALSGEIFIRRGQFAEAAEALGRLAKIEDAPAKNRATAGIAAVDIFENKLDRTDLALEILVVLHKANLTNLAVRERLARAAAKTSSWKEAADILEELMVERPTPAGRIEAAQLAMAIRRDRLSDRAGATKAMVKLLEESPGQGDAIDLLLAAPIAEDERRRLLGASRNGLLADVAKEPSRGGPVRRLAQVAHALGDTDLEQTALAASSVLGTLDDAARASLARLSQSKPKLPRIALTDALLRSIVASGDDGPVAELFALLGPTLAEALGPTLAVMGISKKERVDPRAGSPVRQEVAAWAGSLGLPEFELYVGGREPLGVQGIPGEPHSLVVGAEVRSPFPLSTRSRVARELFAIARGTTLLRLRDETTVLAIVVASCKLAEVPIDAPGYAVQAEIDRLLGKAIARKTKKLLPDICQRIVQTKADARVWSQRAIATLDRIAAVATGDVGVVLSDIHGQSPERLADVVHGDRRSEDLLRFALSPGYLAVRRTLGLEGGS
jgi:tetratricopeptide (TPR) repeat protein